MICCGCEIAGAPMTEIEFVGVLVDEGGCKNVGCDKPVDGRSTCRLDACADPSAPGASFDSVAASSAALSAGGPLEAAPAELATIISAETAVKHKMPRAADRRADATLVPEYDELPAVRSGLRIE
jgi:hypothetical protein